MCEGSTAAVVNILQFIWFILSTEEVTLEEISDIFKVLWVLIHSFLEWFEGSSTFIRLYYILVLTYFMERDLAILCKYNIIKAHFIRASAKNTELDFITLKAILKGTNEAII